MTNQEVKPRTSKLSIYVTDEVADYLESRKVHYGGKMNAVVNSILIEHIRNVRNGNMVEYDKEDSSIPRINTERLLEQIDKQRVMIEYLVRELKYLSVIVTSGLDVEKGVQDGMYHAHASNTVKTIARKKGMNKVSEFNSNSKLLDEDLDEQSPVKDEPVTESETKPEKIIPVNDRLPEEDGDGGYEPNGSNMSKTHNGFIDPNELPEPDETPLVGTPEGLRAFRDKFLLGRKDG